MSDTDIEVEVNGRNDAEDGWVMDKLKLSGNKLQTVIFWIVLYLND